MRRGGARTTCWRELRGGSEAELKLHLGAEILGSEDPRSRGDQPGFYCDKLGIIENTFEKNFETV